MEVTNSWWASCDHGGLPCTRRAERQAAAEACFHFDMFRISNRVREGSEQRVQVSFLEKSSSLGLLDYGALTEGSHLPLSVSGAWASGSTVGTVEQ